MPELPEVETVRRGLQAAALPGRRILSVKLRWPKTFATPAGSRLAQRLPGRRIEGLGRYGKYLLLELSGQQLLTIHLRMTGKLFFCEPSLPPGAHDLVSLILDDGRELRYHDPRRFGRFQLLPAGSVPAAGLGPDAMDGAYRFPQFLAALKARNKPLKALLLDQSFLAGVGNIYADEALWDAALHPRRLPRNLSTREAQKLFRAIRRVLTRGIRNLGTSLGPGDTHFQGIGRQSGQNARNLQVFRRTGSPCPRCRTPIERIRVAARSTHFCPFCQTLKNT